VTFSLHPQLAADTIPIGNLPHCRLLLMNNAHFPWLILVPRGEGLREIFDLPPEKYALVMDEVRSVAETFHTHTQAHKMNIATLGNMVPQLHIHIIARFENDVAWPNPVWNCGVAAHGYEEEEKQALLSTLREITNL
jgi:diadenosine tetraphosphate (Ap4A) HIT family hydrolase